jgi:fatty-acyl-CoA synthase
VKSGGENVSITYVNSLLLRIFADDFEDAQTVAIPDEYWGARLVTWVRLKPGKVLSRMDALKAACKGRLADYEIPKNFLEWEGPWPVNQIGKLETKVLEEKAK